MSVAVSEQRAVAVLRDGGVIAHATEGVYGLACRANHAAACKRIIRLKGRNRGKSFIVVVAAIDQLSAWIDLGEGIDPVAMGWPGPETWIFATSARCPRWLRGPQQSLAVRVTAHPQFRRLCERCGPLVSTSANLSGRPSAITLNRARRFFRRQIDSYLPGKLQNPGRASRIRDARSGTVLRK